MNPVALDAWVWCSGAVLAAELDADGVVLQANPALERFAGRPLGGEPLHAVLTPEQREAFRARLAAAGEAWSTATFAFAVDRGLGSDRIVWLRRFGDVLLLVAEPAVGEQQHLVEKVLELNDDLVATQRELMRERERLRAAHEAADAARESADAAREAAERARDVAEHSGARVAHLEAIAAAGLVHTRVDDVLAEVLRVIAAAVGADRAVLLLLDPARGELAGRAAVGIDTSVRDGIRVPLGEGVAGRVAASGRPALIPDLRDVPVVSAYLRETSRSMAAVPLVLDGEVIGVLHVTADEPGHFGADDLGLLVPAAERAAVAISRAQAHERERHIAETLQRALLPERLPEVDGIELTARFTPGSDVQVGGDWYDALPLPSGELAIVIGDVEGKGVRAASLMGELRAALRAYALDGGPPQEILGKLNRLAVRSGHMATAQLALVDVDTGAVRFASAGHLPPLRLRARGGAELLEGGRSTPLIAYRETEPGRAVLEPGDRLVLYTDGLVERRSEGIDVSLERLLAAARALPRGGPLDVAVDGLVAAVLPDPEAAHDDVALIALERLA